MNDIKKGDGKVKITEDEEVRSSGWLGISAIKKLKVEQQNGDTEAAHGNADDILCKLLRKLGYASVVEEYHKIHKWYA